MGAPILKRPGEAMDETVPFELAIVTVEQVGAVALGLVAGAAALIVTAEIAAGGVRLRLEGGSDGERYRVDLRVEDLDGQLLDRTIEVAVIEPGWSPAGGGIPYLTITDFVERFGLDEVVRMTDIDGSGRIDRAFLTRALADGQAIADAHLAGRYALPLTDVPAMIGLAIADLARNRLYPRGAPEGVSDNAKQALRTLERIQSGAMPLDIAGAAPAQAESATPILISPWKRRYPDGLDEY